MQILVHSQKSLWIKEEGGRLVVSGRRYQFAILRKDWSGDDRFKRSYVWMWIREHVSGDDTDWLDRVTLANPFAADGSEASMVEHMNDDHAAAIAHYVELAGLPRHEPAQMVGVDTEGFHLRIGQSLYWLAFPTSCNNPKEVREALVMLARAEVWPTDGMASA